MTPIAVAPPSCHTCGHIERSVVQLGNRRHAHDSCLHPTGPHPMHEPCAWHSDGALMRVVGNEVRQ